MSSLSFTEPSVNSLFVRPYSRQEAQQIAQHGSSSTGTVQMTDTGGSITYVAGQLAEVKSAEGVTTLADPEELAAAAAKIS